MTFVDALFWTAVAVSGLLLVGAVICLCLALAVDIRYSLEFRRKSKN